MLNVSEIEVFTVGSPTQARFYRKVTKTGTCWIWTAATISGKYGYFRDENMEMVLAHVQAYLWDNESIDAGNEIHHLCGVYLCVNPTHLIQLKRRDHLKMHAPEVCHMGHADWEVTNSGQRRCRPCSLAYGRTHVRKTRVQSS